jgi:DNA-directed RNA polymerase beta subunit
MFTVIVNTKRKVRNLLAMVKWSKWLDNLRGGVPMATPVFDGAEEADINGMLEKAGLNYLRSGAFD